MKKLNKKGFTLIELLAVITIMGILMLVAIPAVQRTIENSRRDTFKDTAQNYANAVRTMWLSDSFNCRVLAAGTEITTAPNTASSAVGNGAYYVLISSASQGTNIGTATNNTYKPYPFLLQQGGKSSWGSRAVTGIVKVTVSNSGAINATQKFEIVLTDGTHGIKTFVNADSIKRSDVVLTGGSAIISNPTSATAVMAGGLGGVTAATIEEHLCVEA